MRLLTVLFVCWLYVGCAVPKQSIVGSNWLLKAEILPDGTLLEASVNDTLLLSGSGVVYNNQPIGRFQLDDEHQTIALSLDSGQQPSFAIYPIDGQYFFAYELDSASGSLKFLPLNDRDENELISIEGSILLFQALAQKQDSRR